MKLTIHRGASEIGGSCVEIATDCTRIILDVGAPLDEVSAEQRLPKVGGLFGAGDRIDAILLSHAHLDHSGLLSETTSSVPVYLTTGASKMLLASALYGAGKQVERSRQRTVAPGEEVTIGDLKVMFHPVDHSVYGSTAIRVEADGKRILYSGDLRLHGRKPGMAKSLIAFAKAHPIDLLLMEGTNLGQSKKSTITELEVEDALLKLFRESASLVLCFFSPQNLDRLVSFYKAARKNGRTFVADRYTAAIMYLLHTEVRIPMPSAKAGIRVYFNSVGRKCQKIEKHFRNAAITWDEIASSPDDYVMIARLPILERELRWQLPVGTLGIFSMWSGYLDRREWIKVRERIESLPGDCPLPLQRAHPFGRLKGSCSINWTKTASANPHARRRKLPDTIQWRCSASQERRNDTNMTPQAKTTGRSTEEPNMIQSDGSLCVNVPAKDVTWYSFLAYSRLQNSRSGGWNSLSYWNERAVQRVLSSPGVVEAWTRNSLRPGSSPAPRKSQFMLKREMSIERADLAKREDDKSENADNARLFLQHARHGGVLFNGQVRFIGYEVPLTGTKAGMLRVDLLGEIDGRQLAVVELKKDDGGDSPFMAFIEAVCYGLQIIRCKAALLPAVGEVGLDWDVRTPIHLILAARQPYWVKWLSREQEMGGLGHLESLLQQISLRINSILTPLGEPPLSVALCSLPVERS